MKAPKIALHLFADYNNVKDKPVWQRHLYARLAERAGKEGTKIRYADRDAASRNPTRSDIQIWYEQIYSELAKAYVELQKEHEKLQTEEGHLHRSINSRSDQIADLETGNLNLLTEKNALLGLITRAYTAQRNAEELENLYGQS